MTHLPAQAGQPPQADTDGAGESTPAFQAQVASWVLHCFGARIAADRTERNHRMGEEALELMQSLGCTASEAHQLVDYVFSRPVGDPHQELGGTMVTLAALAQAAGLDMHAAGRDELARVWTKAEKIRAKQAAKPAHSPLAAAPSWPDMAQVDQLLDRYATACREAGAAPGTPRLQEEAAAVRNSLTILLEGFLARRHHVVDLACAWQTAHDTSQALADEARRADMQATPPGPTASVAEHTAQALAVSESRQLAGYSDAAFVRTKQLRGQLLQACRQIGIPS
jgi:hypothetical protein